MATETEAREGEDRDVGEGEDERSIFRLDGEHFLPTGQARGPWDPQALHGGAPAALIASAFERVEPGAELRIGRLSFEFLRPIPLAPLALRTEIVRPGRRVQELRGELLAGEETIVRALALRVQPVPGEAVTAAAEVQADGFACEEESPDIAMGPLGEAKPVKFSLNDSKETSFAGTAMEMRWLNDPWRLGPGRVWQRLRYPFLPGESPSALARLAATADFCNGVSATLRFDRFIFINADLSIHLHREPRGEWIGLDARTRLHEGGAAVAEGVLHDQQGVVGRAFQTLVVQPR